MGDGQRGMNFFILLLVCLPLPKFHHPHTPKLAVMLQVR